MILSSLNVKNQGRILLVTQCFNKSVFSPNYPGRDTRLEYSFLNLSEILLFFLLIEKELTLFSSRSETLIT